MAQAANSRNLATVMRRAWQVLRDTHGFGRISGIAFSRSAFASCLRTAWAEARKAAAILAMSAAERAARLADLAADLEWAGMSSSFTRAANDQMAAIRAEMALYRAA